MKSNVKVSVIVPVYNAAGHLPRCIESLLGQSLRDCEFIFVNDGSQDDSAGIIERYQREDARIRLVSQRNEGVSAARNAGLREARGEYVGFVDADDHIAGDMYETLFETARQSDCDVVISQFESELEGRKAVTAYPFPQHDVLNRDYIEREIIPFFIRSDELNTACTKLYRHRVIKEHGVQFPYKVALGEDGMFNMQFFKHASSARYIGYTGYYYREVAGSATRNRAAKDYFARALEVYRHELDDGMTPSLDRKAVERLKSIRLIHSVISYIYIYFNAAGELSFRQRWSYVSRMIRDPHVREALPHYFAEMGARLGTYDKLLIAMIRKRSVAGLYCATAYSRFRNR